MEKLINLVTKKSGHSHEIIDVIYAYHQSLNEDFKSTIQFINGYTYNPNSDLNIYLDYLPEVDEDSDLYDLVLYSNGCEPLSVGTDLMANKIQTNEKFFLISNSYLAPDHTMKKKVIWYPGNVVVLRDLWCRPFTPHYFKSMQFLTNIQPTQSIIYINGRNDTNRHHMTQLLQQYCPDIPIKSSISTSVHKLLDSQFESDEDTVFRDLINDYYDKMWVENSTTDYYNQSKLAGINGKFGIWPPGYELMPEYFQYKCVIFPESCWQNDEVSITEKILKCCYSGSLPWPIGGSMTNQLYKEIGFYTAWNLLPIELQEFDSIKNHWERYKKCAYAISWLYNHPELLNSDKAKHMQDQNKTNFYTCMPELTSVKWFDKILTKFL